LSGRLDYHDPFHEFAGRLTEALEDNGLVGGDYELFVDVDHMSREYRYMVHLDGEPSAGVPQPLVWRWAELRFLVDALSLGRHVAEHGEGVEFSSTVRKELRVFGELWTEITVEQLLMPPDLVVLRRAIMAASSCAGSWSITVRRQFLPKDAEDAEAPYSAQVQAQVVLKEDELVDADRPREIAGAVAAILSAMQYLRAPSECARTPPVE
jgi:hypothetical protein